MRYLLFTYLTVILTISSCDYNNFDPLSESVPSTITANTTLASVAEFYQDGGVDLPQDVVISGTVTTSDSASNFHKMLVIQQNKTSLSILTGTYHIHTAYRTGQTVAVRLDGLRLGLHEGMLSVGKPGAEYDTEIGDISSDDIIRQIIVRTESVNPSASVDTLFLTIPEVTIDMTGRLVRLTGGAFTQGGIQTWSDDSNGERTYADLQDGNSLKVYTNPYASFAKKLLPEGEVDLIGIVTSYKDVVQFKISSTDDVLRTK